MRILANSVITDADITATNVLSFSGTEKLQIYQLDNKFKASSGTTQIVLDFGADTTNIDYVALCGTNISESATVTLGYSSSSPSSPEATISLPKWSTFNQIFMLDTALDKRYWVIDISDPDYQGDDAIGIEIGYLAIGKYKQFDDVVFPIGPSINILSELSTSATLQEYGTDTLDYWSSDFNIIARSDTVAADYVEYFRGLGNTEHCVIVERENYYDLALWPPHYGIITSTNYGYTADGNKGYYVFGVSAEERF